ncbi:L domain-like protein [Coniophora puteana RWD-64-598 SS2]|uniref:L domain-like protein n=1 Tax=Coniophora puteana (strain RWD-64-598) TaxID=741705 RepID=A0A5M3MR85_CONPW|nr:L domain-like protein [Coniophora puteana RWD-64-598 SS2]EIW81244.1 L domain-like protein [Coniophora puteana RWD-64-598 SS2]
MYSFAAGGAQDECGSPTKSAYVQKPTPLVDFIEDDASGIGQDILPAELTGAPCLPNLSSLKRDRPADDHANATFLTEWSFGVAHDRLVQVITDIQPFEPYWEELTFIDLSKRALDSVARLKEFLPQLDRLSFGIPSSVRTLSVASNVLTSVTSFSHLVNLESLDISHNDIDSLKQLQCLRHLRELRADGNKIDSLAGLEKMNGLVKLSLQGNQLQEVDFTRFAWSRLEMLNLSRNKITGLLGLSSNLPSLISLNVDNNALNHLDPGGPMPRLRILRVSGNRLQQLNASLFPNLRTLYADNNSLGTLTKAERLTKLENLSMRNQGCRELHLPTRQFRDVKRLYLSGNKLKTEFIAEPCYNLVYLEVAACRLTSLPRDLAKLAPNLRVLNLNYNFLEDAQPLEGLTRLKKLTLIGSRLKGTKSLIRVLQRMPDAEMLDFRRVFSLMNPCTLGWYLPLLVKDVPGALQPSESGGGIAAKAERARSGEKERGEGSRGWQELDAKFRQDLPNDAYVGRLAYRGLVMRACPRIRMLDGVEVSEKERTKANHLLQGLEAGGKITAKAVAS